MNTSMGKKWFRASAALIAVTLITAFAAAGADGLPKPLLAFQAGTSNDFAFNTGLLRGKLHAGGASKGLTGVIHIPTGARIDSSMGLFGHYRMLAKNKRYDTAAWNWPSQATLEKDGSVSVKWEMTDDRPFELHAVYRWVAPDTLDLETSLIPYVPLTNFEAFIATYCSSGFTNASVWASPVRATGPTPPLLRVRQPNGDWQAFPRDDAAFALIQDGRWAIPPNPVDWKRAGTYARPLALRRDPANELALIVMADGKDCFAVLSPHETDTHRSLYLSLFGRDGAALQTMQARTRLIINTNLLDSAVLARYKQFASAPRN